MINTILFDLDGTLLSMDTDLFIKKYFEALTIKLKDYFNAEEVIKYFWNSTEYMITNTDPNKTNQEAFFEDFYKNVGEDRDKLNEVLEDFYENDFYHIKGVSEVSEEIVSSVKLLKDKGYNLVVATNPLFPLIAVLHRIKWAGLDPEDFSFITSFEDMHFCKPQIKYYSEVLERIDKKAQECLMVGNNIDEDMIAKEIGIETYLITNNLMGDLDNDKNIDHVGEYSNFYNFVNEMPKL